MLAAPKGVGREKDYTRTSFITQAFFHFDIIASVPKSSFYPEPRTRSNIVELTPREKAEFETNRNLAIQRQLAAPENQRLTVDKAIKTVLNSMQTDRSSKSGLSKQEVNQYKRRASRRELRQMMEDLKLGESLPEGRRPNRQRDSNRVIGELGLPDRILSQQFSHLDNQSVRLLAQALINEFE